MRRRFADIPFSPARLSFFYGWAIIPLGALGIIMSVPGQTMGVSVFTDHLIKALDLTRVQLSAAYMGGTVTSALLLTFAGYAYDRYGVRVMAPVVGILLGTMLVALSASPTIARLAAAWSPQASLVFRFALIYLIFLGIRFFGQGVLTMISRNMIMKWFDRRRGLASGISGMIVSPCFAGAPRIFDALMNSLGWQNTALLLAAVLTGGFALFALVFYRDSPEECGLLPDGDSPTDASDAPKRVSHVHRQFTLGQAARTPAFWIYSLSTTLFGLYITGVIFHITAVFGEHGYTREQAFSIFLPAAAIALVVRPIAGWLCDYVPLRTFLVTLLLALVVFMLSTAHLNVKGALIFLIVSEAFAGVMFQILLNVTWPKFFSREHLGAISGLSMSLNVAGSAVGPLMFSVLFSFTGTYATGSYVSLVMCGALLLASGFAQNPQKLYAGPPGS